MYAVLVRHRINRVSHIDRVTGEPIRRYEAPTPGDLIHVDVMKHGNVPDGGGWRYLGRPRGQRNFSTARDLHWPAQTHSDVPSIGTAFGHTVIDGHSRVSCIEIHDAEPWETAAAVQRCAVAWFAERGVIVHRVLSDHGPCCYCLWRDTCTGLGITRSAPAPTGHRQSWDRVAKPARSRRPAPSRSGRPGPRSSPSAAICAWAGSRLDDFLVPLACCHCAPGERAKVACRRFRCPPAGTPQPASLPADAARALVPPQEGSPDWKDEQWAKRRRSRRRLGGA